GVVLVHSFPTRRSSDLLVDDDRGFAPERHAQLAEQGAGRVIATGARDDGDVHPVNFLDLVVVDLREDHLLLDADRVVTPAVKARSEENTSKLQSPSILV